MLVLLCQYLSMRYWVLLISSCLFCLNRYWSCGFSWHWRWVCSMPVACKASCMTGKQTQPQCQENYRLQYLHLVAHCCTKKAGQNLPIWVETGYWKPKPKMSFWKPTDRLWKPVSFRYSGCFFNGSHDSQEKRKSPISSEVIRYFKSMDISISTIAI